jgi:hypothetical protein
MIAAIELGESGDCSAEAFPLDLIPRALVIPLRLLYELPKDASERVVLTLSLSCVGLDLDEPVV